MKLKVIVWVLGVVLALLSIPLIAMQFTDEVQWELGDFILMFILLSSAGFAIAIVINKVKTNPMRFFIIVAVLLALILLWMELAVGIFGSPIAGS